MAKELSTAENKKPNSTATKDVEQLISSWLRAFTKTKRSGKMIAEPVPFEKEFPEEAQALMEICKERSEKKAKEKRLKPLFLDSPTPMTMVYKNNRPAVEQISTFKREEPKVGRNDKCPCGSGKKYKKCCIMEV